ncbi:hypothetical protein [Pleurocapsa sp. PCC 7319]|uniref:hypothetical protein n=1 Tax=Pleurocapsa sp. PCC 7319 TaxID=118161 RepID=UPI000344922F|nr:hypothetical protein [Pleurocapsa sp. PCC 7319]
MLNFASKLKRSQVPALRVATILNLAAITLVIAVFLKAVIDIDKSYDPGWYHLPFAGRIWGIIPKEMFIGDEEWFEPRFEGFPLLAHFLQGFFWKITGRIQSTNLVSFFAIFGYFCFLRSYFKVPFYLAVTALFSIPLVLFHASSSFVDLLGNIGVSMLIMMIYRFYTNRELPQLKALLVACLGATMAANTKTLLQPLVFIALIFAGVRIVWLYYQHQTAIKFGRIIPLGLLATVIIFATPVKNTVIYGNPLYPIRVEIAGVVLNHKRTPKAFEQGNRQINWISSMLDINTPNVWSADQWSPNPERNRRGGFFGAYVVFNLLLLLVFVLREFIQNKSLPRHLHSRKAIWAVLVVVVMSLIPLNFPASHELRYFLYWMITLVSLNLYLLVSPGNNQFILDKLVRVKFIRWIYLIFVTIVLIKTSYRPVTPVFFTLDKYVNLGVNREFLSQIKPHKEICLISQHMGDDVQTADKASLKYAFLYTSYFHPELESDYSIKVGGYYPNHEVFDLKMCGDRHIVPQELKELP